MFNEKNNAISIKGANENRVRSVKQNDSSKR